ncbi:MAG: peptidyl-prolyl cis-trans isomerase [Vicinamibacteria bacterium]
MRLAIISLALIGALGASQREVVERVVAKVNGKIITKTELDREVQRVLEQMGPDASAEEERRRRVEMRPEILQSMIDNMLVLQLAAERGLEVPARYFEEWKANIMEEMNLESDAELARQMELQGMNMSDFKKQWEHGLLIQEIRRIEVDNKVSVSEPEIEKYYQEHITEYTQPAKVRLREIVVRFDASTEFDAVDKAKRMHQDLLQGASFAEVARLHSDSSSRDAGGDLGFFEKDELAEPLNEVAFNLAPSEISEVLRMGTAFYIVTVEEKTEEQTLPIEDVRKTIADSIYQEKVQEQSKKYIAKLREQAIIEIQLDPKSKDPATPAEPAKEAQAPGESPSQ